MNALGGLSKKGNIPGLMLGPPLFNASLALLSLDR